MQNNEKELIDYIKGQLEVGMSEKDILDELRKAGVDTLQGRLLYIRAQRILDGKELHDFVTDQVAAGVPEEDIVNGLQRRSLDRAQADRLVHHPNSIQYRVRRKAVKNLAWVPLFIMCALIFSLLLGSATVTGESYVSQYTILAILILVSMFIILRSIYRIVRNTSNAWKRIAWILGSLMFIVSVAGVCMVIFKGASAAGS